MGQPAPYPQAIATVVRRPLASDPIGNALRDVYLRDASVPDDMAMLLAALNDNRAPLN